MRDDDTIEDGDRFVPPCGHRNAPGARFCDVCGAELPRPCPRCGTLNRRRANFCNHCGSGLRDARPQAAPSIVVSGSTPDRSAAGAGSAESTPASTAGTNGVEPFEPLPWTTAIGKDTAVEETGDAARLEAIEHFLRRRRAPRRRRAWLGVLGVTAVIGLLAAAAARTHVATRSVESPPPAAAAAVQAAVGVRADAPRSAPGGDGTVAASRGPHDATIRPDGPAGQAPPAAGEPTPAAVPVPRAGGTLTFVVPAEPPSYDAHREETFALMHPAAPHYNTLLRIDPRDPTGTRVVGDLATSWSMSPDRRTYVLRLRRGVKFHDGSEMTSRDVRATYEKIINPPPGITSARRGEYLQVETIQAPEPYVVAFKLKWPSPSFLHSLASPWNWIYKADILERDVRWYETHVMGTGPFVFVGHVKGSHWIGRRNPAYWDRGKPYLDGYQALFIRDDAAQASVIKSGGAQLQFRGFSPAQRDGIVRALGDRAAVQESPWNCGLVVAINHEREPFHDRRVRRALSLALDRYRAAEALAPTAIVRQVAGVQVPGSPFATPPPELAKLAGYWRDIRESRSEARRLLAEAGVPGGFAFTLKNRDVQMPYAVLGAWLVDEWRRIGLDVRHETQDSSRYFKDLRSGNFEVSTDFQCGYVVDPDLDLYKFQSRDRSDANYGRYTDRALDDLYVRQSRTVDPEQRRRLVRAFEKRLLDEEAHYLYTLQWHRIVPHDARVHGWTITPSHYLNNQLDTVWLSE